MPWPVAIVYVALFAAIAIPVTAAIVHRPWARKSVDEEWRADGSRRRMTHLPADWEGTILKKSNQ